MGIGFTVYPSKPQVNQELIEQFKNIPTSHISDSMNRMHGNTATLKPFHKSGRLIGTALTVRTRPGDNLMIHQAINMARPGDVLVVDGGGDMTRALFGEIMMFLCQSRKLAGLVVDGCIRDIAEINKNTFPVYAKGITHKGPYKTGPGEINVPVSVAGLVVNPGDLIVGDEDGIISIHHDELESVLAQAIEKGNTERKKIDSILKGKVTKSDIDQQTLMDLGCKFYNE